ncbi:MAG: PAS domain S-box protein [Ignavibacteria bacterium]|nr:PAS domain S-box protein [Ignavibacteria bacterium]
MEKQHEQNKGLKSIIDADLLNTALNASANVIVITDLSGKIIWANKAFEKLTGYKLDEIIGQNPRILKSGIHDVDFYKKLWQTISKGEIWEGEILNKKKDGTFFYEQMTITPVFDKKNEIINYVAVKQDISEKKKLLEALFVSEKRFRTIFENSPIGIMQYEKNGYPKVVNKAFCDLLGYTENELKLLKIIDITHPDDIEKSVENINQLFAGEKKFYNIEKRYIKKNGEIIWVDVNVAIMNDENNSEVLLGMIQDISPKKQAEIELKITNEKLIKSIEELKATQKQLLESEKLAVLGQLITGIGHELNTPLAAIKAAQNNLADSISKSFYDLGTFHYNLTAGDFEILLVILAHFASSENIISTREERKIKRELLSKLNELNIKDSDKIAEYLIYLNIWDIDYIKPLFENSNCVFILETAKNLLSIKKNNQTINNAADKASFVINALKKYSYKSNTNDMVPVDLAENIETVLALYNNQFKHGVELIKEYQNVPKIFAHPDELTQVWINILQNAMQAIKYKGIITIGIYPENGNVVVSIKDSGTGIPVEIQNKIFAPFFTTKQRGEGSGIGLDIVKKIIDAHSGKIEFSSKINKGTTFFVKLPIK